LLIVPCFFIRWFWFDIKKDVEGNNGCLLQLPCLFIACFFINLELIISFQNSQPALRLPMKRRINLLIKILSATKKFPQWSLHQSADNDLMQRSIKACSRQLKNLQLYSPFFVDSHSILYFACLARKLQLFAFTQISKKSFYDFGE
jgi:hypothetical protein